MGGLSEGARMRLLHVTPPPTPPLTGSNIYLHHYLKRLSSRHDTRMIVIDEEGKRPATTNESLADAGIATEQLDVVTVPRRSPLSLAREALFSRRPPGVRFREQHIGARLRELVDAAVAEWKPDVLVVWRANVASILAETRGVPKTLYTCDCLSMVWRSVAAHSRNPIQKAYGRVFARRYAKYERTVLPHYEELVFIAQRDIDHVHLPAGGGAVSAVANGVDTEAFAPGRYDGPAPRPPRILHHGVFFTPANDHCARFILGKLGVQLETEFGPEGFEIRFCGRDARPALLSRMRSRPWARWLGYVDDLPAELAAGSVYVAPLAMGGGVKNKILEAMASGLPVVGTPEAFSGLAVASGVHVVSCPLDRIAKETADLMRDAERRLRIGAAAREWVVDNASWESRCAELEAVLERCARRGRAADERES